MQRRRRVLLHVALTAFVILVAAACDGDGDEPGSRTSAGPSASSAPVAVGPLPCPDQEDTVTDPAAREGGSLSADVDDDGVSDEIFLVVDEGGPEGCRVFLVGELADGVHPLPLDHELLTLEGARPRLVMVGQIDGTGGADVVVMLHAGASTEFEGVFAFDRGRWMQRGTKGSEAGDLFPYGGSVTHLEASDCGRPGTIVVTSAFTQGDRYVVEERAFVFNGRDFVLDPSSKDVSEVGLEEIDSVEAFSTPPFGSCRPA
ncbi:MAG TPA: hypothetical protein VFS18_03075 [Actinomycetota bacterium]|nr:hypothetical protein [Actinomycetota bacterium]